MGVEFRYLAAYKLVPAVPSPPEAAAYEFDLLKPHPAVETGRPPYIHHYKVSILKLVFPAAAKAAGFVQKDGKWMFHATEDGTGSPAKPLTLTGRGWNGLSGSYATRLYLPEGAQVPPNYWHAGRYLGLSEAETIVMNGGAQVSIVLNFDPVLETDQLRDTILKSLKFLKPQP